MKKIVIISLVGLLAVGQSIVISPMEVPEPVVQPDQPNTVAIVYGDGHIVSLNKMH